MNSNREELIFGLAVTKTGAERAEFLGRECAGDPALAAPTESARPTIKLDFAKEPPDESIGQKIGRYKILERVGEGGCGVIYVAEQTEPVRRRVAVKVIKLGMDTNPDSN